MSSTSPIRPEHFKAKNSSAIPPAKTIHGDPNATIAQNGSTLYKALRQAQESHAKKGEQEINLTQLEIPLNGKMINASDALQSWYQDASKALPAGSQIDALKAESVLTALSTPMSLARFQELLGGSLTSGQNSPNFFNSIQTFATATNTKPSVNITYSSDAGSSYINISIENFSLDDLTQAITEKYQSKSTANLVSDFISMSIRVLNDTIALTAKGANAIKEYVNACNTLIGQMNSAASVFKGDSPPDSIDGDAFFTAMTRLGFPADEISVHGSSGHDMDADNIQTNIAMINSKVDILSQSAQQAANILSQLNQSNQQMLQFYENFLQGMSSVQNSIASNI